MATSCASTAPSPTRRAPICVGVLIGSEGTLAVVTKVIVRILRRPESVQTLLAAYDSISAAGLAVSEIIAAGIIPAAVEIMDSLSIEAVEAAVHPNFPPAEFDPDRRARWSRRRGPRAVRRSRSDLPPRRRDNRGGRAGRGASCTHLEGQERRVRVDGARDAELLRAGRRGAAHEAAGGARAHPPARGTLRPADRQRVSCR